MPDGPKYTARLERVLAAANDEAHRLHHEYVGTEHQLLGLIKAGDGVGMVVLRSFKVDLDAVRREVEEAVKSDQSARPSSSAELPYSSRAKNVLEFSIAESHDLGHSYIGTDHLLLGILREGKGVAAQVLRNHNISLDRTRTEIVRLLAQGH